MLRLIAINRELTHDNHAINRDSIFVCVEALTLFSGFYGE